MNLVSNNNNKENHKNLEALIQTLNLKIDSLKKEFNLFFTGEIKRPPEQERESLEKSVRDLLRYMQLKSSSLNLLIQNISSRFSLYNNMWKKRLTQIESGVSRIPKKKSFSNSLNLEELPNNEMKSETEKGSNAMQTISLNLNNETSFDYFVQEFRKSFPDKKTNEDKIINNLKLKMISENIISAKANLSVKNGKIKISIKRTI